jgi:serine/threonine-protein kinase
LLGSKVFQERLIFFHGPLTNDTPCVAQTLGVERKSMEDPTNRSLGRVMAEDGLLPLARTVDLVEQIANALQEARAQGIVLADLHPDAILVTEDAARSQRVVGFGKPDDRLATGAARGGSRYKAPEEQVAGTNDADERADQFSLAAIAYEMLTGCSPYSEEDLENLGDNGDAGSPPRRPPPQVGELVVGLPAALDDVFRRAMSFDPGERFSRVEDFTAALRAIAEGNYDPSRAAGAPADDPAKKTGQGPVTAKVPVRRQAGGIAGWMRALTGRNLPVIAPPRHDGRVPPPMVAPTGRGPDHLEPHAAVPASEVVTLISRRRRGPRIALGIAALAVGAGALIAGTSRKGIPTAGVPAATAPVLAPAAAPALAPAPEPPVAPAPAPPPSDTTIASASAAEAPAVAGKRHRPGRSHIRRGARHAAANRRVSTH